MMVGDAKRLNNVSQLLIMASLLNLGLGTLTPLPGLALEERSVAGDALPCWDSGNDCIEQLSASAITSSSKLKTLNSRIALIDERLALMAERIDYAQDRQWTSYITLDPVKLVQNLFGGGEVQRDRLAIADLEIKAATLEAARAELERQVETEKILLGGKVLQLVLDYEAAARQIELVRNQLETFTQQQSILRIQYRFGQGNTAQFLAAQERGERLRSHLTELDSLQQKKLRELGQLTTQ